MSYDMAVSHNIIWSISFETRRNYIELVSTRIFEYMTNISS